MWWLCANVLHCSVRPRDGASAGFNREMMYATLTSFGLALPRCRKASPTAAFRRPLCAEPFRKECMVDVLSTITRTHCSSRSCAKCWAALLTAMASRKLISVVSTSASHFAPMCEIRPAATSTPPHPALLASVNKNFSARFRLRSGTTGLFSSKNEIQTFKVAPFAATVDAEEKRFRRLLEEGIPQH